LTEEQFAFGVAGPFDVPFSDEPGGRSIDGDSGRALFQEPEARELPRGKGCYVFGIRGSYGLVTPWYIGKTSKSDFETECFTSHKLVKYNRALTKTGRGTPVLIFLVHPRSRGKPNSEAIDQLETFMIQLAAKVNPNLLNLTKKEGRWWSIRGFEGKGRPSLAAKALARTLGQA
jgi:hypothetical protein